MKTCCVDIFMTFISLSILILNHEAHPSQRPFQTAVYNYVNSTVTCHEGYMSLYISNEPFTHLPFNIYVQDEQGRYHQAMAIAHRCHYFIGEEESFVMLAVPYYGCFVRRQKYTASLTVVIKTITDEGGAEITKPVPLICRWGIKEEIQKVDDTRPLLRRLPESCNKDGFNIIISQNATVPPLNLDTVRIPSDQSQSCKPKTRSSDTISFNFPFSHCGTQSVIADGIITYWVNVEARQLLHYKRGSIFRDTPFQLTVRCSFALARISQLGMEVRGPEAEDPSTLRNEGILRTEMRFAKDSSYRYFYSSRDPPEVRELGQPVYVDVFVLKGQDEELELLLDDCWATPTEDPNDPRRWNLLVKGCPFIGDSQKTVLLPVVSGEAVKYPSLHKWFVVKLFSFVEPPGLQSEVYFHCDTEICKGTECSRPCNNRRRRLGGITERKKLLNNVIVSGGPAFYLE